MLHVIHVYSQSSAAGKAFLGFCGEFSAAGYVLVGKVLVVQDSWVLPPYPLILISRHSDYAISQRLIEWHPELRPR